MKRLDQERQSALEPERIEGAKAKILELGLTLLFESKTELRFAYKGKTVKYFPYSGWHTGQTIEDGRGFNHLFDQFNV